MMINIILWAFCLIVFCLSVWKESADFPIEICRRRFILGFLLILICGPMLCMGFDLIRLSNISSRSYTAFGIYEAVLLLMLFRVYHPDNVKIKRIAFGLLAVLILVGNIGLIGRSAMNQSRLNRTESSLITRIIYRMEQMPDFKPTTPLVVAGQPTLGQIGTTGFADFNLPATGQFSRTFAFNEVSGYSFTYPSPENNETAEKYLKTMTAWPSANSVKFVDGIFIVKLS